MPKIVVSNTTPLITLLGIGQLDLLQRIYQRIIIPEAVYIEIEEGKDKAFYADLKQYDWIQIVQVQNQSLLPHLQTILDKGEAEVIALAEELTVDIILLDERLARNYAKIQGFTCVGSFGVLLKAKDMGLIQSIKPLLEKAQKNGISPHIFYFSYSGSA
jgi:hypothetical protein